MNIILSTIQIIASFFGPILAAIIAVYGLSKGHQLNIERDRKNKQDDLRIRFLIEAYRRLESSANRDDLTSSEESMRNYESAIADIFLMGNLEQVSALSEYMDNHSNSKGKGASIYKVLELLRQELRKELNLSYEDGVRKIKFFRFERNRSKRSLRV